MAKVVIKYNGISIHKDSEGELWGQNETDTIKSTRQYDGDIQELKEDRPDLAFMIEYGSMEAIEVGEEEKTPEPLKTQTPPKAQEPPKEEAEKTPEPPKTEADKATGGKVTVTGK